MGKLDGKRALVTGASRGIGAAIALRLAQEGADVAITYGQSQEKAERLVADLQSSGVRSVAIKADSADAQAVKDSVADAASALGGLDILVNNAGTARYGTIETASLDDIEAVLNVNVRAAVIASAAALGHMGQGGRIITVGSNMAERVPMNGMTLYAMSKSALLAFTRGLAREVGGRGITVNVIQPGPTDTDMNPASGEHAGGVRGLTALGRYAEPSEIAAVAAFLASPEAAFMTGAAVTVDGGMNA